MKICATLLMLLLGACGGHHGALIVDTPVTPYQAPDISEITGIEEPDPADESTAPEAAPAATTPAAAAPAPATKK